MIYFIQHGNDGPVKIGSAIGEGAKCVIKRLDTLQTGNPMKLRIIGFCQGGEKEEILLHKQFRKHRISGEWFDLKDELINLIMNLSNLNEKEQVLYKETISIDELVKKVQDDFNCNIYYRELSGLITRDKYVAFYEVLGKRRYKYEECKGYLKRIYKDRL